MNVQASMQIRPLVQMAGLLLVTVPRFAMLNMPT
jgi:hypothetical protein